MFAGSISFQLHQLWSKFNQQAYVLACVCVHVSRCVCVRVCVCGSVRVWGKCFRTSDKHLGNGTMINFHYFLTGAITVTNSKWSRCFKWGLRTLRERERERERMCGWVGTEVTKKALTLLFYYFIHWLRNM